VSTRNYFDRRDAIPGFTFLLFIFLLNSYPLSQILSTDSSKELMAVFVTLATLLSGSAIGFLTSQSWWLYFQQRSRQYFKRDCEPREAIKTLIDKFHLTRSREKNSIKKVLIVFGYVVHHEGAKKGKNEIFSYTTRRYDLYCLLSATEFSLVFAVVSGIIIRIIYKIWYDFVNYEIYSIPIIIGIAIVLFIELHLGRNYVINEWDVVSSALIKQSELSKEDLMKLFPEDYFERTHEE